MASVQFSPARAKQWWTETVKFLTFLHLKYKINKSKRYIEIFEDIKNRKILPLHLSRTDLDNGDKPLTTVLKQSIKHNRKIYPLAMGSIEFDGVHGRMLSREYSTPPSKTGKKNVYC